MSSEQWKEEGNCNECRKQKYCGKKCKAHEVHLYVEMSNFITQKMDEKTGGVFSQIMAHSPYK